MTTSLKVGETLQLPVAPKYVSTNTAILRVSASGLVTALRAGAASVRAITAIDVVDGAPTPPPVPDPNPPPPPTSGGSNEPIGMTVLTDRYFASMTSPGWDDSGNGKIASDITEPFFLRTTLPAGFAAGSGSASGDFEFAPRRTLYVDIRARYSENWKSGDAGLDKLFYVYEKGGTPSVVFVSSGVGSARKFALMEGQEILAGGQGHGDAANPDWGPNQSTNVEIVRGRWFRAEAILVGNTAGNADGSILVALDGVTVIKYAGIKFVAGDCLWSKMHYTNIWTGAAKFKVPADQTLDFDHFYLSGK